MATATAFDDKLHLLFPTPAPAPDNFAFTPARDAGPTHDSAEATIECLKDNYRNQHIFFNDRHFHNHAAHHVLAIYAMGANRKLLETAYKTHKLYQKPAFPSPEAIDDKNWKEHLGDENYYQAYLTFFSSKLISGGKNAIESAGLVLEQYILSKDANIVPGKSSKHSPLMLGRYLGGFLHPLIHSGCGAEFGLLGTWAEGLAEACVQGPSAGNLFSPSLFETASSSIVPSISGVISQVASLTLFSEDKSKKSSPHALAILARVAQDPDFKPSAIGIPAGDDEDESTVDRIARVRADKLNKILEEWAVVADHGDLQKKLEEVVWMNVLVYAVAGWGGRSQGEDEKKKFNADFFLMHSVTSVLFMPSLIAHLNHQSAVLLLRTYFLISVVLYVARGRPALPIDEFYKATTASPVPPGPHPTPAEKTFFTERNHMEFDLSTSERVWENVEDMVTPNPWLAIIQSTLVHPNEHSCKAQRSLAHWGALLGQTAPGHFSSLAGPGGLDGADVLDGTLFVRAAGLTADRLGWMREGQKERGWDFIGFFEESK